MTEKEVTVSPVATHTFVENTGPFWNHHKINWLLDDSTHLHLADKEYDPDFRRQIDRFVKFQDKERRSADGWKQVTAVWGVDEKDGVQAHMYIANANGDMNNPAQVTISSMVIDPASVAPGSVYLRRMQIAGEKVWVGVSLNGENGTIGLVRVGNAFGPVPQPPPAPAASTPGDYTPRYAPSGGTVVNNYYGYGGGYYSGGFGYGYGGGLGFWDYLILSEMIEASHPSYYDYDDGYNGGMLDPFHGGGSTDPDEYPVSTPATLDAFYSPGGEGYSAAADPFSNDPSQSDSVSDNTQGDSSNDSAQDNSAASTPDNSSDTSASDGTPDSTPDYSSSDNSSSTPDYSSPDTSSGYDSGSSGGFDSGDSGGGSFGDV